MPRAARAAPEVAQRLEIPTSQLAEIVNAPGVRGALHLFSIDELLRMLEKSQWLG